MRPVAIAMAVFISIPLFAQVPPPRGRMVRPSMTADGAEAAVKQAIEQLSALRRICDRDVNVLARLRNAEKALVDPMQPDNAVQKAWEEVEAAKGLQPEFNVYQGVIRTERELEGAKRSPVSADFPRLRAVLRTEALNPASRVVVRNALRLQDEAALWLKVQSLISDHLKTISDIASESLRASDQE